MRAMYMERGQNVITTEPAKRAPVSCASRRARYPDRSGYVERDGVRVFWECYGEGERPYVHNLYRHLAACDLAVVQGGLTTAMELTANRRSFIYFPLKHHFEQNFPVRHRLEHYGAGRAMQFDDSPPSAIARAIAGEIGSEVDYRPVETDGARRAAERIAEML
jgi:hypothetical protein